MGTSSSLAENQTSYASSVISALNSLETGQFAGRRLQFRAFPVDHQRRAYRQAGRRLGDAGNQVEEERRRVAIDSA
jgi:hypothetical protein